MPADQLRGHGLIFERRGGANGKQLDRQKINLVAVGIIVRRLAQVVDEGEAQDFFVGQTAGLQKLAHLMHGNALVGIPQPDVSHLDRVGLRIVAPQFELG